jgi:hypothetical protein
MAAQRPEGNPIPVHITGTDVPAPARRKRKRVALAARTYQLTANDPAQPILPQADGRAWAWLYAFTNNIVVASSKADALSAAAASASGGASLIPFGVKWDMPTTDQVWAGAAVLPTTITVTAFYEQDE